MSVIDVEALLAEVSADAPAGENLEYDPDFLALERDAQETPEQVMGDSVIPAKEPEWADIRRQATGLFGRTKDLRVALLLTRALLRTGGIAGFRDGLALQVGLVERYWDTVHPQLDPDDNNDPTLRVNCIASITDSETFLRNLREAPLITSRSFGRISYRDVAIAAGELSPVGLAPEEIRDQAQISAAFQECDPEALKETASLVKDVLAQVRTLEDTLTRQVGVSKAASFGALTGALKTISKFLDARLAERGLGMEEAGGEEEAAAEGATAAVGGAPAARGGVPGDIASRDDVIRVLDRICAYYDRCEPSSPVPILLKRARRLVPMGFLDIVRDLAPGGVDQVELIRGTDASA